MFIIGYLQNDAKRPVLKRLDDSCNDINEEPVISVNRPTNSYVAQKLHNIQCNNCFRI